MANRNDPRGRQVPPPTTPPLSEQILPQWTRDDLIAWALGPGRKRVGVLNVLHEAGCPGQHQNGRGCRCTPDHMLVVDGEPVAQIVGGV